MPSPSSLDPVIWALIFGGLLVASLGVFVRRADVSSGWTLIVVGLVLAAAGAVLIGVRARSGSDPPARPDKDKPT